MHFLITQVLNGLVSGMILFLTAAGLSLIFGLMNVVNVAHGSFFMLGAFVGLSVQQFTGSFWAALLLAPLPALLLGAVMERVFIRPLYRRGHLDQVLLTFGFTFVFVDAVRWLWGSGISSVSVPPVLDGIVRLGGIVVPKYRLFLIFVGLLLALVLWLVIERTRLGAMVRASVDDAPTAEGMGINVPLLQSSVFAAGVGIAALGGAVAAPIIGVYTGMDIEILIPAFIVVVIGGMGSLSGAFFGSVFVGLADTLGRSYLPGLSLFLVYVVMIVVLLTRPAGLFVARRS
ncbi:MAG: branched-chain amino acid ABC transporter permease [Acetobacteraceae bacterium]